MAGPDAISDVEEAEFDSKVIARSHELPVVVDFWAEWCGPCRTLGPALEAAVAGREGAVELAKVDVDSNQALAARYGIQGIPAVKAFRDGAVVEEFVGAQPPAAIESFLDLLVPSEAEALAEAGDEESLRKALESDPRYTPAAVALGRMLIGRGEPQAALEVLRPHSADFIADGLAARAELALADADSDDPDAAVLRDATAAWDAGDAAGALEGLQLAVARAGDEDRRDLIRRVMVGIFTELGPSDPLATEHRRRLASALN